MSSKLHNNIYRYGYAAGKPVTCKNNPWAHKMGRRISKAKLRQAIELYLCDCEYDICGGW